MDVTYFRPRRPGPELFVENVVSKYICDIFPCGDFPLWSAGSLTVGAGMPDLIVVSYRPQIHFLNRIDEPNSSILAYLRAVKSARSETIVERLGGRKKNIRVDLGSLVKADIVNKRENSYYLNETWRSILPDVIAIEAKVSNWKKAVQQAVRNKVFAHRSFVAFPEEVALRVWKEPIIRQNGLGVISVKRKGSIDVLKKGRWQKPRVWEYYYKIALFAANQ